MRTTRLPPASAAGCGVAGRPHQARPDPPTAAPSNWAAPGRSSACRRMRSATSSASAIRPASSSALTCASAMLNLMCGASERAGRDGVSRLCGGNGFGRAARVRGYWRQRPGDLGTDDGKVVQRKVFRRPHRRLGLIHREPVHREEGVDVGARRRQVIREASSMISLARAGSPSAHSMLLDRRNANLARSSIGQLAAADVGEHGLRLLAPAEPRQCVRPNEVALPVPRRRGLPLRPADPQGAGPPARPRPAPP